MAAPFSVSVRPARVLAVLGAIIAVLVGLSVLGQSVRFGLGYGQLLGLIDGVDVDAEANIPTFFACAQLLLAAGLAGLVAVGAWRDGDVFRRHWVGLSLLLGGFAIDEFVQLHEQLATLPFLPARSGVLFYAWVLPGMALVGFFGMAYARFFWALPARWKGLFGGAAAVFVGGAIGVEMIGGWYASQYGEISFVHAVITTVEEALEMGGIALLVYALLDYLRVHYGALRLDFDVPSASERRATGRQRRPVIGGLPHAKAK